MGIKIIADLVDDECIIAAALLDAEGFTLERTSSQFKPNKMSEIIDLNPDQQLLTLVGEKSTIIISKLDSGHSIAIQCPIDSNLGKARQKLARASTAILPFL